MKVRANGVHNGSSTGAWEVVDGSADLLVDGLDVLVWELAGLPVEAGAAEDLSLLQPTAVNANKRAQAPKTFLIFIKVCSFLYKEYSRNSLVLFGVIVNIFILKRNKQIVKDVIKSRKKPLNKWLLIYFVSSRLDFLEE